MDYPVIKMEGGQARVEGFGSVWQSIEFERLMERRKDLTPVTAREFFEFAAWGDAAYLLDTEGLELGMHPFREIHDLHVNDDNGSVPVFMARGTRFLDPDAVVLVLCAEREPPRRSLSAAAEFPARIDLGDDRYLSGEEIAHPEGGFLSVVDTGMDKVRALVVWRRDRRARLDLRVVGGHSTTEFAAQRLHEHAERFSPGREAEKRKSRRPRDGQREKVYRFEAKLGAIAGYRYMPFDTIEKCADYLGEVYAAGNIAKVPPVGKTRDDSDHCYYRQGHGIFLNECGRERWTILHEAAHEIARRLAPDQAGHGPAFVGVLCGLLEVHADILPEHVEAALGERPVEIDRAVRDTIVARFQEAAPAQAMRA